MEIKQTKLRRHYLPEGRIKINIQDSDFLDQELAPVGSLLEGLFGHLFEGRLQSEEVGSVLCRLATAASSAISH